MPHTTELIQGWLDRARAGGEPSRDELLRLCDARVREILRGRLRQFPRVRSCFETDDVFVDVMLGLHRSLDKHHYPTPDDLWKYTRRIIRNALLDAAKKVRRRRLDEARSLEALKEAAHFDPPCKTDHPIPAGRMEEFHRYVEGRPEQERELFDLLYYEGLSLPQAAELLEMPLSTLKKRWQAARIRLVERLGRDGAGG